MFIWFFIILSYLSLNSFLLVIAPRARRYDHVQLLCLSKKFEQICQADERMETNCVGKENKRRKATWETNDRETHLGH